MATRSNSKLLFKILIPIAVVVLFIVTLTVWRNSTPEIGDLAVSAKVNEDNKPVDPTNTFDWDTIYFYVSGRLAHVNKTEIIVELYRNGTSYDNYHPKELEIETKLYPNNYFSFTIDSGSPCPTGAVCEMPDPFLEGEYELKIYPKGYSTFFKPTIKFKVVKAESSSELSAKEKTKIDQWIIENDLNQYGDPKNTVYLGGTPLFNEITGGTIDRYEYILKNHPDQPWNK